MKLDSAENPILIIYCTLPKPSGAAAAGMKGSHEICSNVKPLELI